MFKQKLNFTNTKVLKLSAIFEGENRDAPIVVMCHGFASSKDAFSTRSLAQKLVKGRLSVFRFDFTGCGQSEGGINDLTPLQGLDDLKCAAKNLEKTKVALYGSSFGGYIALLYALKNPVLALALKAPVSDYLWVAKNTEPSLRRKSWAREVMNIDIYKEARKIKMPIIIVHGDNDRIVPIDQSRRLLRSIEIGDLIIIKGAVHKMRGEDLEKANTLIADFFEKTLTSRVRRRFT